MKCRTTSALNYHAQGTIDAEWAIVLVEETTARPTVEFVSALPTAITNVIQIKAAAPPETVWITLGGGDINRFLAGLALWRDYFGSLEEEQP